MWKINLPEEDEREIKRMLESGCPYREIAEEFGVSVGYIRYKFSPKRKGRLHCIRSIVYPNLAMWMYKNNVSRQDIAEWTQLSKSYVNRILCGRTSPTFEFILIVLDKTGLTFEEAFSEKKY